MKLFKQRLLELLISTGLTVALLGMIIGILKLLELIYKPLPAIIFLLIVLSFIIYGVGTFIYWLFIEPFHKDKTK